jgi:HSP20 family protein
MTITRFTPFRGPLSDAALLQNRLNSIFQDFSWPTSQGGSSESLATGNFVPAVDIYEDAQKVVVKVEAPGVKQEDLDVRVENNTLTIKGERKFESEEKEENFHRIERRYGNFVRSFSVPQTVDTEGVTANYDAGILTVTLAKKAEAKPKQVKIGIGTGPVEAAKPKQVEAPTAA